MDTLSGGTGTNAMAGGLDADLYVSAPASSGDSVSEQGGIDRLDVSYVSFDNAQVSREYNDLLIRGGGHTVRVQRFFVAEGRVEQFIFADGTYAAGAIEYRISGGTGGGEHTGRPVVLDLDGDGVQLVAAGRSKARFDVDGDGDAERMGWMEAGDGMLVLDRNGDGRIRGFSEISFVEDFLGATTDFEGLYAFDSDHDGFLTGADARFAEFQVWVDANGNGHSETKELFYLEELSIASLNLESLERGPWPEGARDAQIVGMSFFERADGSRGELADVAFFLAERNGFDPANSTLGIEARVGPEHLVA